MNGISIPVIHPSFQNLRKSGRLLHLTAAFLIISQGLSHYFYSSGSVVLLACQLILALDIVVMVFASKNLLVEFPKLALFFRFAEGLYFFIMGAMWLWTAKWVGGGIHLLLATFYFYLFFCENRLRFAEFLAIHHTGITIPALPESKFLYWSGVNTIETTYTNITIHTTNQRSMHFSLRKNLGFEELEQIHEFCRHYLGKQPGHTM